MAARPIIRQNTKRKFLDRMGSVIGGEKDWPTPPALGVRNAEPSCRENDK
jgi:hypothetical protein